MAIMKAELKTVAFEDVLVPEIISSTVEGTLAINTLSRLSLVGNNLTPEVHIYFFNTDTITDEILDSLEGYDSTIMVDAISSNHETSINTNKDFIFRRGQKKAMKQFIDIPSDPIVWIDNSQVKISIMPHVVGPHSLVLVLGKNKYVYESIFTI